VTPFYQRLAEALKESDPFALALISGVRGSSPQKQGAKALFFADGTIAGTLGGGCLEAEIQDRARRAIRTGAPATFELVLDHDFGWDDGLICGGQVEGLILPAVREASDLWNQIASATSPVSWGVRSDFSIVPCSSAPAPSVASNAWRYMETVHPREALWIAGSGHIAQAVAEFAHRLEFEVSVFDDRPALANRVCFPHASRFRVDSWERLLEDVPVGPPAYGLIVTRGHQHDALVLKAWLARPFVFLGMIGSRRKARMLRERFIQEGWATESTWAKLSCPVGIDLPGTSVSEIAISIVAELIQRRAAHRTSQLHPSAQWVALPGSRRMTPDSKTGSPRSVPISFGEYGAVILAAGASTRMGCPKMLLPWGKSTVIQSLVEQWLRVGVQQVLVVIRADDEPLRKHLVEGSTWRASDGRARILENSAAEQGMWSSVLCASNWGGWIPSVRGIAIALGDQPHLEDYLLDQLLMLHREARGGRSVARPRVRGQSGHPVVLAREDLQSASLGGAAHLKDHLERLRDRWSFLEVEDSACLHDMDVPEDYRELIALKSVRSSPSPSSLDA